MAGTKTSAKPNAKGIYLSSGKSSPKRWGLAANPMITHYGHLGPPIVESMDLLHFVSK